LKQRAPFLLDGRRNGFTLVEVIVVLVILAILAAIAIPALTGYIDKARYSSIKAEAREIRVALQTLFSEAYADPKSHLPEDNSSYGKLYIGNTLLASPEFVPDDIYYISLDSTHGTAGNTYTLTPNTPYYLLSQLTKISLFYKDSAVYYPVLSDLHIDSKNNIIEFAYTDAKSFKEIDATNFELITCFYNMDPFTLGYDPSAGFQLYQMKDGTYTKL
jgi:prepilin-type N-terminal cleavage/methylation domain-containing protein